MPALVAVCVLASAAFGAPPGNLFTIDGRPARRAVVTAGGVFEESMLSGSAMLERLEGVLAELDAKDVADLRKSARAAPSPPESVTRIGVVHLLSPVASRRVELSFDPAGTHFARDLDDEDAGFVTLDLSRLGDLMIDWRAPMPPPPGRETGPMKYPSRVPMSDSVATQRYINRGRSRASSGIPEMGRTLSQETFRVRLPARHDPSRPAGVIVWVSPTPDAWWERPGGAVPTFGAIADELGLIIVGAERNGNQRPILDRLQVALDSLETVRRAHLVDDERVYVTGMSGGGRCTSILTCMLPEIFCGGVPIVGLSSWHTVPLGDGRRIPQHFSRARRDRLALLRTRRIRSITGDDDFNAYEMRERTRMLKEDGLDIMLDDYPGMGHVMPTPEQFAKALRWVDEPRQEALEQLDRRGDDLMREHIEAHGDGPPGTDDARENLVRIASEAPWTDAAWQAAAWLGHERP